MLHDFFKLNGADTAAKIATQDEFLELLRSNTRIENVIFVPDEFRPTRPQNVIRKKFFCNVSFRSTRFYGVEFRDCTFEDCLFVGSEFDRCEIHDCSFTGCNFQKVRLVDTYVDPKAFVRLFDPARHANIGVWVFQQLRSNALNTHQPEFFQTADWQFRRWRRHELIDQFKRDEKTLSEVWWQVSINRIYEFFVGYGHSLTRFAFTSLVVFAAILSFNCWFWQNSDRDMAMTPSVAAVDPISRGVYYAVVTLTTLGYGDITPITAHGMFVAAAEALIGLVWFGMLTSIIVKKVFR
jgi:hypothetical protein